MFKLAIDKEKAKKMLNERCSDDLNSYSMCVKMCAMNTINQTSRC